MGSRVRYQQDGVLDKLKQLLDNQKQQYERLSLKPSTKEFRLTDIPRFVQVPVGTQFGGFTQPVSSRVNKFPENLSQNKENFEITGFFCNQKPKQQQTPQAVSVFFQ